MTMAKVMTARVDVASTAAAMLGVTQAAAAVMGVLTVWTTSAGLIDIPAVEQVCVGIVTVLMALALGLGCARTLTGQSPRLLAWSFCPSLAVSAYWSFLRSPAHEFPVIPGIYAVFPVLGLVLLAYAAARSRSKTAQDEGAADVEPALAGSKAGQPAHPQQSSLTKPTKAPPGRDMLLE